MNDLIKKYYCIYLNLEYYILQGGTMTGHPRFLRFSDPPVAHSAHMLRVPALWRLLSLSELTDLGLIKENY